MPESAVEIQGSPPTGWKPYSEGKSLIDHVGPIWQRKSDGGVDYAFRVSDVHLNLLGVLHGGMLSIFADHALGMRVWALNDRLPCATIQLDLNFVAAGRLGDFVECRTEVVRRTRSLFFMRGTLLVGERPVASASGVWKVIGAS
jgi:acyl-coenzyme A thioesterase PaaI-like protein